jgi:hypothetical protein
MNDKYTSLEQIIKIDYNMRYKNYDKYEKIIKKYTYPQKTQEQEWQEQLEKMDTSVVEKFLRKKKLENIKKDD